ncbi:MAG: dihydrolipoyl dehydrogenase [bacterium]|nr:dihydrolipoyl dehydrogenase [bacterium]
MEKFDLIVIGGGMGGYGTAIYAAKHGLRTVLIEKNKLGGTCLNRGCIPTKVFLGSVHKFNELNDLEKFAIYPLNEKAKPSFRIDLVQLRERKRKIVETLVDGVGKLLQSAGVSEITDTAEINSDKTVKLSSGEILKGDSIVIATGSEPLEIPPFNFDGENILSSNDALELKRIPEKLAIIGAGAIGCEFSEIYSALGSKVTVFEMMPQILPGLDSGIVKRFAVLLKAKGIIFNTGVKIENVKKAGNRILLDYAGKTDEFDAVLVSIGRKVNSEGISNEIERNAKGGIKVNMKMETNIPGIFAVGDINGVQMLAHSAVAQGQIVIQNLVHKTDLQFKPETVPFVVYTDPELAGVGFTEEQVKEKFGNVKTGNFTFRALGRALAEESPNGMVKVIGTDDEVKGVFIFGKNAGELIHSAVPFISNNIRTEDIVKTVFAHPTLSEAVKEAFEDFLGLAIHTIKKK